MSKKKTHEEFVEELNLVNPNIEVIGTYQRDNIKIKCRCKIDGYEWEATPSNLLRGYGCSKCKGGVALTTEDFAKRVTENNKNLRVIGEYVNNTTPVLCYCDKCKEEVNIKPLNFHSSPICPNCRKISINQNRQKRETKKNEQLTAFLNRKISFFDFMENNYNDIEILSDYIGFNKEITCKCKKDNFVWNTLPNNLMRPSTRSKCPRCNGTYRTTETLQEDLDEMDSNITLLGEYVKNNIHIKCKCNLCGNEWNVKPNNLLNGTRCPACKLSRGESAISSYLERNNIEYCSQKTFEDLSGDCKKLRYDFYLKDYNLLIEFQGIQHEQPVDVFGGLDGFVRRQRYDNLKRSYALKHNIPLLEIWYYDFNNIEQILSEQLNTINNKKSA